MVGEALEKFTKHCSQVVEWALTTVGLSHSIIGSRDSETSIMGLPTFKFIEGVKGWADWVMVAGGVVEQDGLGEGEEEADDSPELNIADYELHGEYILGVTD